MYIYFYVDILSFIIMQYFFMSTWLHIYDNKLYERPFTVKKSNSVRNTYLYNQEKLDKLGLNYVTKFKNQTKSPSKTLGYKQKFILKIKKAEFAMFFMLMLTFFITLVFVSYTYKFEFLCWRINTPPFLTPATGTSFPISGIDVAYLPDDFTFFGHNPSTRTSLPISGIDVAYLLDDFKFFGDT